MLRVFEHGALKDCDWVTQQVTRSETAQPRGPKQLMPLPGLAVHVWVPGLSLKAALAPQTDNMK